jgi:hypothetical protein
LFVRSFVRSFIHSFIRSFIHSFIPIPPENCSRVYEAITRDKDHRGKVVAAGAVRTLINLGNDGNDACRVRH